MVEERSTQSVSGRRDGVLASVGVLSWAGTLIMCAVFMIEAVAVAGIGLAQSMSPAVIMTWLVSVWTFTVLACVAVAAVSATRTNRGVSPVGTLK